jgi:hypothetical protein
MLDFDHSVPLTPTLSLGERENRRQSAGESERLGMDENRAWLLPLPEGEGWGEGKRAIELDPLPKTDLRPSISPPFLNH